MAEHSLTVLPKLTPDAATQSGKCTCQVRFSGASEREVTEQYQAHLDSLDDAVQGETGGPE